MNIVLIDPLPEIESALRAMGHDVHSWRSASGVFHLPAILQRMAVAPDLVLQQEKLGERAYLSGLESIDCPTCFWAVDSHLNMFWQQWYALLFDALLTPHLSLFRALPAGLRPRELRRFAWPGQQRAFVPHARRRLDMSLVARMTIHRPIRQWLADLLQPLGLHVTEGLSQDAMMRLYDDTRVVPNECIANEVNFRLLEGASCGCLLLSPDVGEDQDALLRSGEEFFVYHDGLELLEQAAWAKRCPQEAEAMGKAAMRRVQAEHLPEHRAAALVQLASCLTQNRLTGASAALAFWITLAMQTRNQGLLPAHEHARLGLRLAYSLPAWRELPLSLRPFVSHAVAQALCLFAEKDRTDEAERAPGPDLLPEGGVSWPVDEAYVLCRNLLADAQRAGAQEDVAPAVADAPEGCGRAGAVSRRGADRAEDPAEYACPAPAYTLELAAVASAFALRQGAFSMALAFWSLYAGKGAGPLPADAVSLCLAWSAALEQRGSFSTSGFHGAPDKGCLPTAALSYHFFALTLHPDAMPRIFKNCAALLAGRADLLQVRLGCLAQCCLTEPEDWRIQLEYALACLQGCRVEEGLFEVAQARGKAFQQGRERIFLSRLLALPGGRRIWEATRDSSRLAQGNTSAFP